MKRKVFPKDAKGRFYMRAGNRTASEISQALRDEIYSDPVVRAEFEIQCAENLASAARVAQLESEANLGEM